MLSRRVEKNHQACIFSEPNTQVLNEVLNHMCLHFTCLVLLRFLSMVQNDFTFAYSFGGKIDAKMTLCRVN